MRETPPSLERFYSPSPPPPPTEYAFGSLPKALLSASVPRFPHSDRNIRIVDFGLSTRCAPGQVLKHACGSPCYAAPEMLTRSGQQHGYVGHPVDVWSAGVTLFAMLCGSLPFEHANTASLYNKIIAGSPPPTSRTRLTTSHHAWSSARVVTVRPESSSSYIVTNLMHRLLSL